MYIAYPRPPGRCIVGRGEWDSSPGAHQCCICHLAFLPCWRQHPYTMTYCLVNHSHDSDIWTSGRGVGMTSTGGGGGAEALFAPRAPCTGLLTL